MLLALLWFKALFESLFVFVLFCLDTQQNYFSINLDTFKIIGFLPKLLESHGTTNVQYMYIMLNNLEIFMKGVSHSCPQ
jgi:hypothetical protein